MSRDYVKSPFEQYTVLDQLGEAFAILKERHGWDVWQLTAPQYTRNRSLWYGWAEIDRVQKLCKDPGAPFGVLELHIVAKDTEDICNHVRHASKLIYDHVKGDVLGTARRVFVPNVFGNTCNKIIITRVQLPEQLTLRRGLR